MGKIEKNKIIRFFISLCISIFIWGYVTNMHNPIQHKVLNNVPIMIVNPDVLASQNLAIDTSSNTSVTVVVEGRYSDIQNITNKDVEVKMDLTDLALKEGSNNISIDVSSLNKNIKIVKEKTSLQSKIDIVKLLQKEIPVVVNATGELPSNYVAGEPIVTKDKVICSGTKEALNDIKYASAIIEFTNNDVADIKESVQLKVINKVGEESTNVILKDKEIEVTVPILYYKEVPIELITKNSIPSSRKLEKYTLDKNTIIILGCKDVLDKTTSIKTEELDLSRRYYDFDKQLKLVFPEGVESKNGVYSVYGSFIVTLK